MTRYLAIRIAQNILTYVLFLSFVFFLIDAQPGDFGNSFINDPKLTAEQRQAIREQLGLNKPVTERFFIWMGNALQGDLGISLSNYPRPVIDVIKERAPRTLVLFMTATVVSFYIGFLSGKWLAWNRGGVKEYVATIGGVGLYTVFTPWFGLMMILIFSFHLGWFPIGKFIDPVIWREVPEGVTANLVFTNMLKSAATATALIFGWMIVSQKMQARIRSLARWGGSLIILAVIVAYWFAVLGDTVRFAGDILWHLILPIITLALISFAGQMLLTRSSMLETLGEDYIMTARAKGLPERVIRDKHAARNAMLPVVTSLVFALAFAIDGGVITESIFSWPGMGQTLLTAAVTEDIPMAIGGLVFTGALALIAHLVADVLYAYLDPRIRYQ